MYERDFAILHPHVPVLCQGPCHWGNVCYYAVTIQKVFVHTF